MRREGEKGERGELRDGKRHYVLFFKIFLEYLSSSVSTSQLRTCDTSKLYYNYIMYKFGRTKINI